MFDSEQRQILLKLARDSIADYLSNEKAISPPDLAFLETPLAAFVTVKINNELRGCIGSTDATESLGNTIVQCAIAAAFRDPRFPPLSVEEYSLIQLEISVLSPFQQTTNPEDVIPGTHGVMITHARNRGLLLPQVAEENEWDRETFLSYTCRKAGLHFDAWKDPNTVIEIFTAEILTESDWNLRAKARDHDAG